MLSSLDQVIEMENQLNQKYDGMVKLLIFDIELI